MPRRIPKPRTRDARTEVPREAVILAAGVGSRLRPLTNHVPKCLVRVAGKPILQHELEALEACGIRKVTIVGGYRQGQVAEFLAGKFAHLQVRFLDNSDYSTTNNMFSLAMALEHVKGPFVLVNGDVVFSPDIVRRLLRSRHADAVATYPGTYVEESMKVRVSSGTIRGISKKFTATEAYGISLDIYRFSRAGRNALKAEADRMLASDRMQWSEVAMDHAFASGAIRARPVDVLGKAWMEIDNFQDLQQAEVQFNPLAKRLATKEAFFFDGDGTLYVEGQVLPGAREAIRFLRRQKKRLFFLTNNSSRAKADYVTKLRSLGMPFRREEIITSADLTAAYLREHGLASAYVVGTPGLVRDLAAAGIATDSRAPDAVVLGYDTTLTYEKLRRAALLIRRGVPWLATHGDVVCPTQEGPIPDAGSMIALLEAATGAKPIILGKPNPAMILAKLREARLQPGRAVHFGDRLYTDVLMGKHAYVDTVCVLSGESTRQDIETSAVKPDLVLADLRGLLEILQSPGSAPKGMVAD